MSSAKISIFDPDKDARGIWVTIHRMAILAVTDEKKAQFINYITFLSKEFPCEKCKVHIKKFIIDNPFYLYMDVSIGGNNDVGMFKWSHNLHNAVNQRLGKGLMDFKTAYNLYSGDMISVCTEKCDEEKSPEDLSGSSKEIAKKEIKTLRLVNRKK
jgi:hypothetical protein